MLNNKKINIGILGCSNVARKYAIESFKSLEEVDKIFLASRDVAKARTWANEFGVEFKNSYRDLIKDDKINAVYISLPISLHEEWTIKCAENDKHVICEKSISFDFDSVKRMVDCFDKRNLVLFENFVCDYHPQHSKILSLIHNGEIGIPLIFKSFFGFKILGGNIRTDPNMLTGALNDIAAYIVFMSRKILQSEPISVVADFSQNKGTLYMKFPGDKVALGGFGSNHAYQNNYSIWGSEGLIETTRAYSISPTTKAIIHLFKAGPKEDISKSIEVKSVNQFELIFKDFLQTILNKDEANRKDKLNSILAQAKIMQALRISNECDRKVSLNFN